MSLGRKIVANDLAPGFIRISYTSTFGSHRQTIPILSPTFDSGLGVWKVKKADSTSILWTDGVDELVLWEKPFCGSSTTITGAELYTKNVGDPPVLVDTYGLAVAGTGGGGVQKASQAVMTYKGGGGGYGKIMLLDTVLAPNARTLPPSFGGITDFVNLWAYLLSDVNIVATRGGGFPLLILKGLTKTNDKLRRKYGMV